MDGFRRRSILTIAGFAAVGCLFAGRTDAQPLVATAGAVNDACANPAHSACTSGIVYVVNGETLQVQTTVDLWRGLPNTRLRKLVVHPSGAFLYAAQSDAANPPTRRWIDVIDLRTMAKVTTYGVAGDLKTISPDGTRLYLTTPASVLVIDSATGGAISSIPLDLPTDIAIAPSLGRIYVAGGQLSSFSVAVLDSATNGLLQTIPVTHFVTQVQLTPDESHLYALASTSRVFDIDTASNTIAGVITDFGGPSSPNAVTFARGRAYVGASFQTPGISGGEGVAVIDVATRAFVTKIGVLDPFLAEASADGTRVWTTTFGEPRVITIDTATNQRIGSVTVPGGPVDLAAIPTQSIAELVIDQPAAASTVHQPFELSGWAVDVAGSQPGPGVDTVHVWAFPTAGGAPTFVGADYGRPRPDVGALFGPTFTNSGYHVIVRGLPPAAYQFVAFGHSTRAGEFSIVRAVAVTIESRPRLVVDTPSAGSSVPLRFGIGGWAIDDGVQAGTGIDAVHVWAYPTDGLPVFAGAATLGDPRPDVAAYLGAQFANAGYHLDVSSLSPGTYTLVVYGHSTVTGAFSVEQQVSITVTGPLPLMFVDSPAPNSTVGGTFVVSGWAVELNAQAGTGVDVIHIWATSPSGAAIFLGTAAYGLARPDVGAWLGAPYTASGFALTASLPAGNYTLSVYARSTTTGTFRNLKAVGIVVR
jgi:hypothetical protein